MQDRPGTWAELRPGMYLRDAQGTVWLIVDEREGKFLLYDRAFNKRVVTRRPDDKAAIIVEVTLADAVNTVTEKLGGDVLGHKVAGQSVIHCPPIQRHAGRSKKAAQLLHSHLNVVHRVYIEPRNRDNFAELLEAHDTLHADTIPLHTTIPHDHVLADL